MLLGVFLLFFLRGLPFSHEHRHIDRMPRHFPVINFLCFPVLLDCLSQVFLGLEAFTHGWSVLLSYTSELLELVLYLLQGFKRVVSHDIEICQALIIG